MVVKRCQDSGKHPRITELFKLVNERRFFGLYMFIIVYIYIIEYSCWIILSLFFDILLINRVDSPGVVVSQPGFPHLRSGGCLLLQPCQQLKVDWLPDRSNEAICVLDFLDVLAWPEES